MKRILIPVTGIAGAVQAARRWLAERAAQRRVEAYLGGKSPAERRRILEKLRRKRRRAWFR